MNHDPFELLDVAQEAILILDPVGGFAFLPFPWMADERLDLSDEISHFGIVCIRRKCWSKSVILRAVTQFTQPAPSAILAWCCV
jgi:hypothetical protein